MHLSCNHNLEVMKNTSYIEKCLESDAVTYILIFTKKAKKSLFPEKIKLAISVEKGVFSQTWVRAWSGVGVPGHCIGRTRP